MLRQAEASEPVTEGANKFHFTSKGHKHTFKASSAAERDNWVGQLKEKIAEAKGSSPLSPSLRPTRPPSCKLEACPSRQEGRRRPPQPLLLRPPPRRRPLLRRPRRLLRSPPRRSLRKRSPSADLLAASAPLSSATLASARRRLSRAPVEAKAAETEAPAAEAAPVAEVPAVAETTEEAPVEAAAEAAPVAAAEETKEETKEEVKKEDKPAPSKRASIFGNLGFGKKKVVEPTPEAAKDVPAATEAVGETAPVIPAVETTEPLSAEVASPAHRPPH